MTDEQETNHAFARSRSNAGLAAINEWLTYLKATGNYESYDAMCECHRCNRTRANFKAWKAANV